MWIIHITNGLAFHNLWLLTCTLSCVNPLLGHGSFECFKKRRELTLCFGSVTWQWAEPKQNVNLTLALSELVAQILAHKSLFTWGLWSPAAILQRWCGNKTSRNELCKLKVQNFLFHFSIHCSGSQLVQVNIPTRLSLFFKMSRDSAIIKFGYENHKEYEDHAAGNRKHSAKRKFCTGAKHIVDRSGTTSAFTRHMRCKHKAK